MAMFDDSADRKKKYCTTKKMMSNCRYFKQTDAHNITKKGQNITERIVMLVRLYKEITTTSKAV